MDRPTDAPNEQLEHHRAWELIPWVVNGSATAVQRRLLDAHLPGCADCRLEWSRQCELRSAIAGASAPAGDIDGGLQRLFARIDRASDDAAAVGVPRRHGRRVATLGLGRWLAAAVVVEALAIAALSVALLVRYEPRPDYLALGGRAATRGATIRVVAAPSMRLDDLQRLLHRLNLQVVAGPNGVGAYDLAPQSEQPARELQLSLLRADPGLRLVEPIDAPASPR